MRPVKTAFFILAVIILQTVVFARLNFLGVVPDLILVSVIAFAVTAEHLPANIFSGAIAFLQDLLAGGFYLNTIIKVVAANVVSAVKAGFVGDDYALAAGLTALFTPIHLVIEGAVYYFFLAKQFSFFFFIFKVFVATIYNLLLAALVFPVVREINRDE